MISLEDLNNVYYKSRLNKRRSLDSCCFEIDLESELLKLLNDINNRTFVAENNYAFVVFRPKPREIFATEMRNRIIHHYLDWRMRDIYEKVLSSDVLTGDDLSKEQDFEVYVAAMSGDTFEEHLPECSDKLAVIVGDRPEI